MTSRRVTAVPVLAGKRPANANDTDLASMGTQAIYRQVAEPAATDGTSELRDVPVHRLSKFAHRTAANSKREKVIPLT